MTDTASPLGSLIRIWRDRLAPVDAGFMQTYGRRAPGLRREELAQLAGLSVVYLVRLEQGRATTPSSQVVGSLARALQLNRTERDELFRAAGLLPPTDALMDDHVSPGVRRMVARLGNAAVAVFRADWQLLTWNEEWSALQGDPLALPLSERNLLRAVFVDGAARRSLHPSESLPDDAVFREALVADLRLTATAYPHDVRLRGAIATLRTESPVFDDLWKSGPVQVHQSSRKRIHHPDVGHLDLDLDILTTPGSDVRMVVYSAAEGTVDAEKLVFVTIAARSGEKPVPD